MPRPKGGKTRVEEEGAEHISTQDVEDAQLRATLAATHVDELRAQVADCSRRQRPKRPSDVVGGAKQGKGKRNRKEKKKPVVAAAVVAAMFAIYFLGGCFHSVRADCFQHHA